jgi:hypothetical protein
LEKFLSQDKNERADLEDGYAGLKTILEMIGPGEDGAADVEVDPVDGDAVEHIDPADPADLG